MVIYQILCLFSPGCLSLCILIIVLSTIALLSLVKLKKWKLLNWMLLVIIEVIFATLNN